ncbi:MAG: hypothetical protein A2Y80_09895 [Deltaproteobacteria bacterium RBG_13_58_19]|nr:MAG: hypothetical protein A2Y80_09895 [Deltaproteobacteria bacterium RBG_13_58_19]
MTGTNTSINGYTTQDWLGYGNSTAQYLSAKDGSGSPTGGVVNNVYFSNNLGGQSAYLIIEIAGYKDKNIFGIYDRNLPANKTVIFDGPAGQGAPWSGPVPISYTSYGFYLTTPENITFYSDTTNVTNPDTNSNFAFFRNTSQADTFYIAMEDLRDPIGTENKGDYNDMIVKAHVVAPIPGSLLLLGTGLVSLAGLGWRRRKNG